MPVCNPTPTLKNGLKNVSRFLTESKCSVTNGIVIELFFTSTISDTVCDIPTTPRFTRKIFSSGKTFNTERVSVPIPIDVPAPISGDTAET